MVLLGTMGMNLAVAVLGPSLLLPSVQLLSLSFVAFPLDMTVVKTGAAAHQARAIPHPVEGAEASKSQILVPKIFGFNKRGIIFWPNGDSKIRGSMILCQCSPLLLPEAKSKALGDKD